MSGRHSVTIGENKLTWEVEELWKLAEGLEVFEAEPLSLIDLDRDGWFGDKKPVLRLLLAHFERIREADLDFPVILNEDGSIMDGAHRVCKAILEGKKSIKAVRFPEMPQPSSKEKILKGLPVSAQQGLA